MYNAHTPNELFELHASLILVSGDGPASADAIGMKKPGVAQRPCHHCLIPGTRAPTGTLYYIAHRTEDFDQGLPVRVGLRTGLAAFGQIESAGVKKRTSAQYGFTRSTSLLRLRTLSFPNSFPLDLMHCVLINIAKQQHGLYGGKLSQKQTAESAFGSWPHILHKTRWEEIGRIQQASRRTIPAALGQGPRPVDRRWGSYKAMEWRDFICRDGVTLLSYAASKQPGFRPYLQHFCLLRKIYRTATSWSISPADIKSLRANCVLFVRLWEDHYYGNDPNRLQNCKINIHSLLHLADHIEDLGPATAWWATPMERYIGVLKGLVTLMSNMDMDLANRSIMMEHLNHLAVDFEELHTPLSGPPSRTDTYPRAPGDRSLEYGRSGNELINDWRRLLVGMFPGSQQEFPINYQNGRTRLWKKYYLRHRYQIGSEESQATAPFNSRNDSYVWWYEGTRRRYGLVEIFAECWDWEAMAIVKPFRNTSEDLETGTVVVLDALGARKCVRVCEIGGLVGRIEIEGKTYLVGDW